jgi:hypothetical protein
MKNKTSSIKILPVVLSGCGTWSVIVRQEYSLRLFENRMLRKKFGTRSKDIKRI